MRWSAGIIISLLLVSTCLQAQRTRYGNIKGTVIDSSSRKPLESSTVAVFLVADSSLVNYAITSRKGEFSIKDIPLGIPCRIIISHSGYITFAKQFDLSPENKEMGLDTVYLVQSYNELGEVTVTAQKPPVVVKPDTLEFNVSSFKTMPNAMVEDVLKQLPGVDIDKDGNITINGKKVTKIMVDGREFFGGDPKIAIKNLPKEVIDKLQVTDNKTREARFNKTTNGNEDLAINLTLRKEVQKGWFGRISAGYGSDERYEAGGMLNFFSGSKQLSVIANGNNTNRGGFSADDFSIANSRSTLDGGGGGLNRSKSAGLNFSDNLGRQLKLNGSYFYNNSHNDNFSRLVRRNILPDSTFFYNADNNNISDFTNHRLSLNASYTIDTLTEMHVAANVNTNQGSSVSNNLASSESVSGQLINTSNNTFTMQSNGKNVSGEFFFSRRFRKRGRGFTVGANYNYNDQPSTNDNIGENEFYKNGVFDSRDSVNQQSVLKNFGHAVSFSLTYAEPLTKNINAILRYNYNRNENVSDKVTNRFNPVSGKYDVEDSAFTNSFRNVNETHSPDFSFTYHKDKYHGAIGSGMQFLVQDNFSATANSLLHQYYINFSPSANMGYNFSKTGNFAIHYNGRSQQPSIHQLQPVPDNSNPLYLQLGNPDLRPSFYHNINFHVRESHGSTYWHTGFNFNTTRNQVIYENYYDSVGRQVSRPVNVNGNYGLSGNIQYSTTWKKRDWSLRMNLGSNGYFNRNVSFINQQRALSRSYSISQSVGFYFTYKQVFSMLPAFNIRYNKTLYSGQALQDADFNTKTFSISAFWNQPKRLIIENNMQYNYNSQTAPGFRKGVIMWSAALNYLLFKKQQGVLRLAVYDILKQNTGVYRSISQTFIEDRQTQILQRYFLLSFVYNLRKFQGAGK